MKTILLLYVLNNYVYVYNQHFAAFALNIEIINENSLS